MRLVKGIAWMTVPGLLGVLALGCDGADPAADDPGEGSLRAFAKAQITSGVGPGSYDLDSKADLGIFSTGSSGVSMTIRQSTGAGFAAAAAQSGSSFCTDRANLLDGDFNNDQLDDIACVSGTSVTVGTRKSDLTGFNTAKSWLTWSAMPSNRIVMVGDFTGRDRRDDLAIVDLASNAVWVAKSSGSALGTPTKWITGFCAGGQILVGDYDGDALEDLACFMQTSGTVNVAKSTGTSFSTPTLWLSSFCTAGSVHVGDFSGDGTKDDLACVSTDGTLSSVAVSSGSAFTAKSNWLTSPGFGSNAGTFIAADYTGDGKVDLGFCETSTNTFKVAASTGASFSQPTSWITAGNVDCSARLFGAPSRDGDTTSAAPSGAAEWTFMVYMAADNSLNDAAYPDLTEMQTAAASAKVNIIVLLDTSSAYSEYAGDCVYLKVTSGGHTLLKDLGECNTGNWQTAAAFVTWATAQYPAKHYALDMWNHGGGYSRSTVVEKTMRDCCVDDHPGTDTGPTAISVANGHWASLLQSANTTLGRKIDLVGFDACIMGMWEVAEATRSYANYLVASEDYEPFSGWVYGGFMSSLVATPTMDAAALGAAIVAGYDSSTLSEIDLSKVSDLSSAVSTLGSALMANSGQFATVEALRSGGNVYLFNSTMVDMGMLASQLAAASSLSSTIRTAASTVNSKLSAAVLQKHNAPGSFPNATGLSIYMPGLNQGSDSLYLTGPGAVWTATQWDDFVKAYAK